MKIGTLSFELKGKKMVLNESDRIKIILEVAKAYNPDFILCSGHSLENNENLIELESKLKEQDNKTTILVEVKYDIDIITNGHPINDVLPEYETEYNKHKMFIIDPKSGIKELGPQFFATSVELDKKPSNKVLLDEFAKNFTNRIFNIGGYRAVALCCGEINILKGRANILCRLPEIKTIIESCDIVVNPTHDGMANYGTLNAKRRYLSKQLNNKNRCYISSSNWNTQKKQSSGRRISQKPSGVTIQSVFINSNNQELTRYSNKDYEFRMTTSML